MAQDNCIFCKIIKGGIKTTKVYEDENTYAFLDISPVNIGHTLVLPKKHFTNIHDTPGETLTQIMGTVKRVAKALKISLKADGVNINMNNDKAAGQVIFHTHIHVIPRYDGDGYEHWHGKRLYKEGEMTTIAEKITKML